MRKVKSLIMGLFTKNKKPERSVVIRVKSDVRKELLRQRVEHDLKNYSQTIVYLITKSAEASDERDVKAASGRPHQE